ncbi:MAG: hypothetical protein LBP63_09815 [Prevotellaceae bacterium]|jgi:hypothetical protein|nr:hypothetical protein [Prevotellaceae bacterium]
MKRTNRTQKINTLKAQKLKTSESIDATKQKHVSNNKEIQFVWSKFYSKLLMFFAIVLSIIAFTDSKGYFIADQTNNHVYRKWKSFYQFTKTKNVDILLLGNSHIMTGLDPFVLSVATGTNCFILGTPGTSVADAYFCLAEALTKTKPQLVILETYCINNTEKYDPKIAQIQSFEANQNILYKLKMMPYLFNSDDWIKAWSPTVRNHSFLLTNMKQIKFNKQNKYGRNIAANKLDLGRFARFGTGIEDSLLTKYETLGAPNKGTEFKISERSKKYLKKIVNLCHSKNIQVLFLSVPMYYKHISDYDIIKATLNAEFQKYESVQWLNLQSPYDSVCYTKDMFENTYEPNQHLTNSGMNITAYKTADFLLNGSAYKLYNRSQEPQWIADFQTQPHFIFNQNPSPRIKGYTSVLNDKTISSFHVKELLLQQKENSNMLMLKIKKDAKLNSSITVTFEINYGNQIISTPIAMHRVKDIMPPDCNIYFADIRKDINIVNIKAIKE